jgi:type III pantothenate kinase
MDVGNTRLKWRTVSTDGESPASGVKNLVDASIFAGIPSSGVVRVRVSCVAGSRIEHLIATWCENELGVEPEFARSQSKLGKVCNGYVDPDRLGVDRWMAVLAAYAMHADTCCIVDCGSAITLDFVQRTGEHLGGLIVPGLTMMKNSLLQDTEEIRLTTEDTWGDADRIAGRSTEEAVLGGIISMTVALIGNCLDRFERDQATTAALILTGGDARILANYLSRNCVVNSALVLDGLAVALP